MRTPIIFLLAGFFTACGGHAELLFDTVTATRQADDTVEIQAEFDCIDAGMECGSLAPYCVRAEWFPREALLNPAPAGSTGELELEYYADFGEAEPALEAETCSEKNLRNFEHSSLTVQSGQAVDSSVPMLIRVTIDSGGGTNRDLERVLVNP